MLLHMHHSHVRGRASGRAVHAGTLYSVMGMHGVGVEAKKESSSQPYNSKLAIGT